MSENLHLEGDFTLNIPSYDADFTENEQPDIQADFNITIVPNIEGSELIQVNKNNNTYRLVSINYTYEQAIASDVWVINHNLNKCPSIYVVDTAGHMQIPDDIEVNDQNTITVTFLAAFAGLAYLN